MIPKSGQILKMLGSFVVLMETSGLNDQLILLYCNSKIVHVDIIYLFACVSFDKFSLNKCLLVVVAEVEAFFHPNHNFMMPKLWMIIL